MLKRAAEVAAQLGYPLYLVGGTVRDLLLGVPTVDFDLLVEGDGVEMARALARAVEGAVTARSQFGTAKVRVRSFALDVATARRECYPRPGALPVVTPGTLQEDLFRRDFTINAMALALSPSNRGDLRDLFGGRKDLEARQLRVLHDKSFQDDPTRMARALRYGQRLGFRLETHTEALLNRDVSYLRLVSGSRRWKELQRLLEEAKPEKALLWGQHLGLLYYLHPSLRADDWLAAAFVAARNDAPNAAVSPATYLCILAFRLSQQERQKLIADFQPSAAKAKAVQDVQPLRQLFPRLATKETKPSEVVQLLAGLSLHVVQAGSVAAEPPEVRQVLKNYLTSWRYVKPHLSGADLLPLGVPPGPAVGECLAALKAALLDGVCTTEQEEIGLVKNWLGATSHRGAKP